METYREEIIQTQTARSDLLQQKLIINAILGGVGLGLRGAGDEGASGLLNNHVYLILCLIPLVCAYIDLLCYHLNLRMFVIAKFLKDPRRAVNKKSKSKDNSNLELEDYRLYEKICSDERDAFSLESFALKASSIVLSLLLIVLPFFVELDVQNQLLDDVCLTTSGIVGIMLAIWIESLSNIKSNLLNANQQKLKKDNNTETQKEYEKYLRQLTTMEERCKNAYYLQIGFVFFIIILLLISALYSKSIAYYGIKNCSSSLIDCQLSTELISQISSDFQYIKIFFIIVFCVVILMCISLFNNFSSTCEDFKDSPPLFEKDNSNQSKFNSSEFYLFLMNNNAKTEIKELPKEIQKDSEKLKNLLLIFLIISILSLIYIYLNVNYILIEDKIISYTDLNKFITLGNIEGSLGAVFIALFTLIPFLHKCFSNYVDEIYNFKSFLPKELGQIQEEFIAKIKKQYSEENKVEKLALHEDCVQFSKSDDLEYDDEQCTFLLLIKCCNGIAIINPSKYFITSDNAIVNVNNDLNQDNLKTGSYWEIVFDFQINIGIFEPDEEESLNSAIQKYQFKEWRKIVESEEEKEKTGIEIGDRTALFFVYTD